jgi:hypothetical protein
MGGTGVCITLSVPLAGRRWWPWVALVCALPLVHREWVKGGGSCATGVCITLGARLVGGRGGCGSQLCVYHLGCHPWGGRSWFWVTQAEHVILSAQR